MIQSAEWVWDDSEQPIPRSTLYQDIYHSRSGGEAQSREVFIKGSGFPERFQTLEQCTILETGFGLGLNFLSTWHTWKASNTTCQLHYLAIERFPFSKNDLERLLAAFPALTECAEALLAQWMLPISGMHRLVFEAGKIVLTLALGDVRTLISEWVGKVDAFYLDGFSPDKNPEMWDVTLFKQCAKLAKPNATIATYTVAGSVRRALQEAGFNVERTQGFGGKRHRLTGHYQGFPTTRKPSHSTRFPTHPCPKIKPKRVAVIGAGIAGCSVTERLALRHINVLLFDQHAGSAQQTSSNRAGVIYPLMTQDNNRSDRITRAAYLWWQTQRKHWIEQGMIGDFPGVVQLAKSAKHARLIRSTVELQAWPKHYVQYLDSTTASTRIGYPVETPAYYFPEGGWIHPPSLCQSMIRSAHPYLTPFWNTKVTQITPTAEEQWIISSSQGEYLVDQIILANAWESSSLLPAHLLQFKRLFGQVHDLDTSILPELKAVVCGDGYVIPPSSGYGCMGATFEWEESDKMSPLAAYQSNATRICTMLPTIPSDSLHSSVVQGGWRTAAQDRLPIVGSLSALWEQHTQQEAKGLWCILALGSRGLVWGPWSGEIIASACCGEPLPLERSLYQSLSAHRFEKKH